MTLTQAELIASYDEKYRPKFNELLFNKNDEDTIKELQNVILSCQRDNKFFKIKVVRFRVIDDYFEIQRILREKEEETFRRKDKGRKRENSYDYINLKDSDIKLMIVTYFMSIKGVSNYLDVYIAIPRIVNKFYLRLAGSIYSAMFQIVESSTYNNTTSANNKYHRITFRTILANLNMYRNFQVLRTTIKEEVRCSFFLANVFNKSLPAMKYIFAKYGFYNTLKFFKIDPTILYVTDEDPADPDRYYCFQKKEGMYIVVDRYIFDNDRAVQSLVYTIYCSINRATTVPDIYTDDFWIKSLGASFNNDSKDKGLSVLDSMEHIYDISTKRMIKLPEEEKRDIYHILRWLITEFSQLRIKDNLDLATKRIRFSEYIAAIYAAKLSKGIYRIADLGNRADIDSIRKAININVMYLIEEMQKSKLVNYRDMVNDCDSFAALKFTYKGIAGIGEKSSNSVPNVFRAVNPSHLGRVDLNASSATDPGLSGILCPLGTIYDNGCFAEDSEPLNWEKEFSELLANYRKMQGIKQMYTLKKELGIKDKKYDEEQLDECIQMYKKIIPNPDKFDTGIIEPGIPLEEGGVIRYGC